VNHSHPRQSMGGGKLDTGQPAPLRSA
jgi:hypothetical protein